MRFFYFSLYSGSSILCSLPQKIKHALEGVLLAKFLTIDRLMIKRCSLLNGCCMCKSEETTNGILIHFARVAC